MEKEFSTYHPVVIFTYFIITMGVTMTTASPFVFGICVICPWVYSIFLKGVEAVKSNVFLTAAICLFTTAFNMLFTHNGKTVLFYMNSNGVTVEAGVFGLFSGIMFSTVIIWFSCFNKIVSGEMIMYLFSRISAVFALMVSMIFRYIPLLKNRYGEITMGQIGLGQEGKGSLIDKIRLVIKKISILISWSLESSIETADSMSARGYGLSGRTSFHLYRWSRRDIGVLIAMVVCFGAFIVMEASVKDSIVFYPALHIPELSWLSAVKSLSFFVIAAMPVVIDLVGEYKWKKLESKI